MMCQFQTKIKYCVRFSQTNWSIVQLKATEPLVYIWDGFFSLFTTLSQYGCCYFFISKLRDQSEKKFVLDIFVSLSLCVV